jgi:hypothetical protein
MTLGEKYRLKAAEFRAKADQETKPLRRSSFETFVRVYQRLASQADRSAEINTLYEAILPPRR